ncbi:extracellular solute-binding protein [Paenibacillus hunanensis]|uniref:extracellular solute-binding protein n=1 Tax=Paenibacillus hunanensis TaxID=539262 RepID=UPI002027177E|nr:extracellular solute-binding protein [Paenibacillus hunanensis]MCL9661971.1 extracellular solute-binding protein [Paenibacillus hunanensis]
MECLRFFGSLSLITILVIVMSGCSNTTSSNTNSSNTTAATPTITIWSQFADPNSKDSGSVNFYRSLEATKKQFPDVNIEYTGFSGEPYKTKITAAAAAQELPDIFFTWSGGFSRPFIKSNRVLALDDLMKDGTQNELKQNSLKPFTVDGKLYGLPTTFATSQLYINKELFQKVGAPIPTTWDEMLQAIDKFKAAGIQPIALGAKDRWPVLFWNAYLDMRMAGADQVNAALNKKASFNTPELQEAATKLKQLVDDQAFGKYFLGTSNDDAINMFMTGQAGMYLMGNWVNEQIESDDSPVKGKVQAIQFPTIQGGKGNIDEWYGGYGETYFINANVKDKSKVWEVYKYFMKTLGTNPTQFTTDTSAWKVEIPSDSSVNELTQSIGKLASNVKGQVYWWDQVLAGNDTETMFNIIMNFVGSSTTSPQEYTEQLQKQLNESTQSQ